MNTYELGLALGMQKQAEEPPVAAPPVKVAPKVAPKVVPTPKPTPKSLPYGYSYTPGSEKVPFHGRAPLLRLTTPYKLPRANQQIDRVSKRLADPVKKILQTPGGAQFGAQLYGTGGMNGPDSVYWRLPQGAGRGIRPYVIEQLLKDWTPPSPTESEAGTSTGAVFQELLSKQSPKGLKILVNPKDRLGGEADWVSGSRISLGFKPHPVYGETADIYNKLSPGHWAGHELTHAQNPKDYPSGAPAEVPAVLGELARLGEVYKRDTGRRPEHVKVPLTHKSMPSLEWIRSEATKHGYLGGKTPILALLGTREGQAYLKSKAREALEMRELERVIKQKNLTPVRQQATLNRAFHPEGSQGKPYYWNK